MSRRFAINTPFVVSEVIDGEAVVMNLLSGHYFSAQGTGALVWQWLGRGSSDAEVAAALAASYGLAVSEASQAVGQFVAELERHELVTESTRPAPFAPAEAGPAHAATAWAPPALSVFTDMQDLLLLHAVHDAGAAGWPAPDAPNADALHAGAPNAGAERTA